MAEIKSSLEIALARTAGVKADKESVRSHELKQEGQKLASRVLSGQETEPAVKMKQYTGKDSEAVREGFLQTLFANLSLPQDESAAEKLASIREGFLAVMKDKGQVDYVHQHLEKFFDQYISDRKHLEETLRNQFSGKMKMKEEQLSKQTGTPVKLNPASDPDFMKALRQNMGSLDSQYGNALENLKEQLRQMIRQG